MIKNKSEVNSIKMPNKWKEKEESEDIEDDEGIEEVAPSAEKEEDEFGDDDW